MKYEYCPSYWAKGKLASATPYFSTFGYYTGNNENISQEILNIEEEWNIIILEFIMKSTTELLNPPT